MPIGVQWSRPPQPAALAAPSAARVPVPETRPALCNRSCKGEKVEVPRRPESWSYHSSPQSRVGDPPAGATRAIRGVSGHSRDWAAQHGNVERQSPGPVAAVASAPRPNDESRTGSRNGRCRSPVRHRLAEPPASPIYRGSKQTRQYLRQCSRSQPIKPLARKVYIRLFIRRRKRRSQDQRGAGAARSFWGNEAVEPPKSLDHRWHRREVGHPERSSETSQTCVVMARILGWP